MSESNPPAHPPLRRRATLSGLEKLKLSAVVLVDGDAPHVERVLTAVGFCDEVVVVATSVGSEVQAVCATLQVPVTLLPVVDNGDLAARAVEMAKHEWVLLLWSDEVLDYEAATTIQVLDYGDPLRSWQMRRRQYIGAREIRFGEWVADSQVRLFNRKHTQVALRLQDVLTVTPSGPVRTLSGSLHQYRFADYADLLSCMIRQARVRALEQDGRSSGVGAVALLVRGGWAFIRSFVVRQGFRDGVAGVMVGMAVALDTVLAPALRHERDGGSVNV